jgi:tripartite-type tricarboxylate transporter receptor subunit TctC
MPSVVQFLQTGTLKAIAVTSKNRASLFPNIPAMSEIAGFEGFDFTIWYGLFARAGTPQNILSQMAKAAVASLKDDRVREILANQSAMPVGNTPAEFGDFIHTESQKYSRIVELTGIPVK